MRSNEEQSGAIKSHQEQSGAIRSIRRNQEGAREHREDECRDAARELAARVELERDELPDALARPLNEEEDGVERLKGRVRPEQLAEEEDDSMGSRR